MKKISTTLALLATLALSGCPVRTDPLPESACPTKPNCGQCASVAVCVWCASDDPNERGCRAASDSRACVGGDFASAELMCPTDARGRQ